MLDEKDYEQIEKRVLNVCDAKYQTKEKCEETSGIIINDNTKLKTDTAVIKTQLKLILWFGGVATTAVVGIAVKYLFGG